MKKSLILLVLLITITLSANTINEMLSDFCNGWEKGYQEAIKGCLKVGLTPICPIPPIGRDTYKHGYGMGYYKGQQECN